MSPAHLLALCLGVVLAVSAGPLDLLLQNKRLYDRAFTCLLTNKDCTPQITKLKDQVLQAMKDGCKDCTPEVKNVAKEVLHFLKEKKPNDFKQLVGKYDPDGIFRKKFAPEFGLNIDNL